MLELCDAVPAMFVNIPATLCLCVCLITCREFHQSVWTERLPRTTPAFGCVAILTGFPEVSRLLPLVTRLLNQLLNDFHVDVDSVHVFCQGDCSQAFSEFPFQYYSLNNTVDRNKYRGFIISRNYKLMFMELFEKRRDVKYCMILEDDLVLAPDSMTYMEAGVEVMALDDTIFTVSLYNDNAYPWCASSNTFVRRVDHFSGLGFIMSKRWYMELVKYHWDEGKVWDHNLQTIMAENKMASIQPEVNRVLHTVDSKVTTTSERRPMYNKYLSQVAAYSPADHNLTHLQKDSYDRSIIALIKHSQVIEFLHDAAFHDVGVPLLHTSCDSDRHCLDKLLRAHGLSGAGLGSMVRGIYQGTVYLRVCGRLLLLLTKNSPFWQHVPNPHVVKQIPYTDVPGINSSLRGLVHHVEQTYQVIIRASTEGTCADVCSASGRACSRAGLWMLNIDCAVLQHLVPQCTACSVSYIASSHHAAPALQGEGGTCSKASSSHWLSCHASQASMTSSRICPCSRRKGYMKPRIRL